MPFDATELQQRAKNDLNTASLVPAAASRSRQVHDNVDDHALDDLFAHCKRLQSLQKQRRFCIKAQSRCDRSVEDFLARMVGYTNELGEAERKALFARVSKFRREVEKKGSWRDHDLLPYADFVLLSAQGRTPWDVKRNDVESEMRRIARLLPAFDWVKGVKGFGDLGFAVIIGETGSLTACGDYLGYATKERVWKRLGLAVIEGERQRRVTGEAALKHLYSPKRRAEVWSIIDSMFKHQWAGPKDGELAHPKGPFGEVYGKRKAHTADRDWSLKHRDNDARRIMGKVLLEELWKEWRRASISMNLRPILPASMLTHATVASSRLT